MERTLSSHNTVTREEWLKKRIELLKEEKELTRRSDALAKKRQNLPWVKIEKEYFFETEEGTMSLVDLFKGRSQLMIYHFMFGPDYKAGCPSCSAIADGFEGIYKHLANHDVILWAMSRAPLPKLNTYKRRMGWTFPWASSSNTSFNYDFNVSFTDEQQRSGQEEYNYASGNISSVDNEIEKNDQVPPVGAKIAAGVGVDWSTYTKEAPGMSSFILHNGHVYHTYSAYARGLDVLWNVYQWLDRAPLGRNEKGMWLKRHDEYENISQTDQKSCCH